MAFYKIICAVLQDQRGATAVEYGLIIAMIVLAMVATLQSVANEIITMWNTVETRMKTD
jgi:pilus assembly protein Flp/PilA